MSRKRKAESSYESSDEKSIDSFSGDISEESEDEKVECSLSDKKEGRMHF